jgi:acetolactate synthase I/II/III large subunit
MTIGELIARFLETQNVRAAFGVISIHNMPILDAINARGKIRFVPSRGEAGAANMADAYARVTGGLGVCVTSTGTGAGNAAGALIEAITAGTPMLHFTGQIDSAYVDKDWGFIHEAPAQLKMLEAVSKAAFRIRDAQSALGILQEATRIAFTPPCGPVSIEIAIDVQTAVLPEGCEFSAPKSRTRAASSKTTDAMIAKAQKWALEGATAQTIAASRPMIEAWAREMHARDGAGLRNRIVPPRLVNQDEIHQLAQRFCNARRPLLWCGGGARGATKAVMRLAAMGFGVVTSTNGRGVLPESLPLALGAYNALPSIEALYAKCDAMLIAGSRLRSNETLGYKLKLPENRYRIDGNALAQGRAYTSSLFLHGDANATLTALADALEANPPQIDAKWRDAIVQARREAEAKVDADAATYVHLKNALNNTAQGALRWVRDITLSNTIWGNRALTFYDARTGVHPLGGGIGQALAMSIGAAVADAEHGEDRVSVCLIGDGGFMLNAGELACAVQENANLLILLMNDKGYGVIKNIQDAVYGGRRCYVDLHTPDFAQLCASMGVAHTRSSVPAEIETVLRNAWSAKGVRMVEIDMNAWGPFNAKPAGPPRRIA